MAFLNQCFEAFELMNDSAFAFLARPWHYLFSRNLDVNVSNILEAYVGKSVIFDGKPRLCSDNKRNVSNFKSFY